MVFVCARRGRAPRTLEKTLSKTKTLALTALTLAAGLGLIGCASGQSMTQACTIVNTEMERASATMETSMAQSADDPEAGLDMLDAFVGEFGAAAGKVTNEEVTRVVVPFQEAFTAIVGELRAAGGDITAVNEDSFLDASQAMTSAAADYQKLCPVD